MHPVHYQLIVNPRGGTRRGLAVLERVRPVFAAAGAELEVHLTTHPGHAAELAAELELAGCAGLCLIGGDGTLHETVSGLMTRQHPAAVPIGVIPGGTGNAVAEHLGLAGPLEAARRILAGKVLPLDVARVAAGGRVTWCVNIIGWGFAVDVNQTAERLRFLGGSRYTMAALWRILRARRRRARLTLDGCVLEDDFLMAVGCNTRYTGKGMKLAPGAEMGDGALDLVVVRQATRPQILNMLGRVYAGTHVELPIVEVHRVRSFAIESESDDRLNLDGELAGSTPVAVELVPSALRIFA